MVAGVGRWDGGRYEGGGVGRYVRGEGVGTLGLGRVGGRNVGGGVGTWGG